MDEEGRSRDRAGRRPKRFLTPLQKYEIYLQVIRGEVTMAEAAAGGRVDRTTVVRIRQVAKDGALSALTESRPGIKADPGDVELNAARAEIAGLSGTAKEMAVKLSWSMEEVVGDRWPRLPPGRWQPTFRLLTDCQGGTHI